MDSIKNSVIFFGSENEGNSSGNNRGDDNSLKFGEEEISNLDIQQILKNQKSLKQENETLKELIENLKLSIKELNSNNNEKNENDEIKKLNDIINEKDSKINNLINEINSIKEKILDDITYNKRITNFEEFIQNMEKINELNNEKINPEIREAFGNINDLIDLYKENDKFNDDYIN